MPKVKQALMIGAVAIVAIALFKRFAPGAAAKVGV